MHGNSMTEKFPRLSETVTGLPSDPGGAESMDKRQATIVVSTKMQRPSQTLFDML